MEAGLTTTAPPVVHKEEDFEAGIEVDEDMVKLSKFTKLIAPVFLVYGLCVLILTILSIVKVDNADGWVTFMICIIATVIFSIIAALGVYKWGTVEEQIDIFKEENDKYQMEIDELKGTKDQLKGEVSKLQETTNSLNRDVDKLKETLSQYDELKNSLEEICGDNQQLNDMINDINDMYTNMKQTIVANTKAGILAAYYDAAFKDEEEGMKAREYKRFLARLDKKTRAMFQEHGDFDTIAGDDGVIDKMEFQKAVDDILAKQGDEILDDIDQKTDS